jgi:hypothetical protein
VRARHGSRGADVARGPASWNAISASVWSASCWKHGWSALRNLSAPVCSVVRLGWQIRCSVWTGGSVGTRSPRCTGCTGWWRICRLTGRWCCCPFLQGEPAAVPAPQARPRCWTRPPTTARCARKPRPIHREVARELSPAGPDAVALFLPNEHGRCPPTAPGRTPASWGRTTRSEMACGALHVFEPSARRIGWLGAGRG